jgi:hypothetical protein
LPESTDCELGEAEMVKSPPPAACTTRVIEAVWLRLPLVPVIVSG